MGPETVQRGSGRGLACLHLGVVEAPASLPLHHVGARHDAIEGAQSGPLDRSGWAGLLALCSRESRDYLLNTLGDLGSIVPAELPICPGPALAAEGQGKVWGGRGREHLLRLPSSPAGE